MTCQDDVSFFMDEPMHIDAMATHNRVEILNPYMFWTPTVRVKALVSTTSLKNSSSDGYLATYVSDKIINEDGILTAQFDIFHGIYNRSDTPLYATMIAVSTIYPGREFFEYSFTLQPREFRPIRFRRAFSEHMKFKISDNRIHDVLMVASDCDRSTRSKLIVSETYSILEDKPNSYDEVLVLYTSIHNFYHLWSRNIKFSLMGSDITNVLASFINAPDNEKIIRMCESASQLLLLHTT